MSVERISENQDFLITWCSRAYGASGSQYSPFKASGTDGSITIAGPTVGAGIKVGGAANQLLAFWGATPVAQQATTGTATGFVTGAGTTVHDDSTFTGGVGTKAYRLSDVVLALKNVGIMASS